MIPRTPGRDWGFGAVFWVGGSGRQYNVSLIVYISTIASTAMSRHIHSTRTRPLCGTNTSQVSDFEHLKHWESLLLHVTAVCPVPRHSWHEISSKLVRGAMGVDEGMWRVGVGGRVVMSMSGVGTILAWDRMGPWKRACLVAWRDDVMPW